MFELWVPITVVAAFLQNARSALQKSLKAELSNNGATFVRFIFGVPFAAAYLALLSEGLGHSLPSPGTAFFLYACVGGLAQVLGTAALLHAVSFRSFAVGTAYSKTEPIQAAVFGAVLLGESPGATADLGLAVSLVGVVALGLARADVSVRNFGLLRFDKGAATGLASGGLFALAAVCYRGASLSLAGDGGAFLSASFTLVWVIGFQSLVMTAYLALREPGELTRVARAWKPGLAVGAFGATASAGWFTAMTLENAALVRAVGQIELIFALAASWLFFRERIRPLEAAGIAAVLGGILLVILDP